MNDEEFADLLERIIEKKFKQLESAVLANKSSNEKLFNVSALAEYLDMSSDWVYSKVRKKEIPFFKVGSHNRFCKNDIDKWLESNGTKPTSSNPATRVLELHKKRAGDS